MNTDFAHEYHSMIRKGHFHYIETDPSIDDIKECVTKSLITAKKMDLPPEEFFDIHWATTYKTTNSWTPWAMKKLCRRLGYSIITDHWIPNDPFAWSVRGWKSLSQGTELSVSSASLSPEYIQACEKQAQIYGTTVEHYVEYSLIRTMCDIFFYPMMKPKSKTIPINEKDITRFDMSDSDEYEEFYRFLADGVLSEEIYNRNLVDHLYPLKMRQLQSRGDEKELMDYEFMVEDKCRQQIAESLKFATLMGLPRHEYYDVLRKTRIDDLRGSAKLGTKALNLRALLAIISRHELPIYVHGVRKGRVSVSYINPTTRKTVEIDKEPIWVPEDDVNLFKSADSLFREELFTLKVILADILTVHFESHFYVPEMPI